MGGLEAEEKVHMGRWCCVLIGMFLMLAAGRSVTAEERVDPGTNDRWARLPGERVLCDGVSQCNRSALVFVHGIWGSSETWRATGGQSWPELIMADPDFANFDVYRVDYETHFASLVRKPSAVEIVKAIKAVLQTPMEKYRNIYLICHSLGGNLIRQYLVAVKASTYPEPHEYLARYKGLFLLGTPMLGSEATRYAQWVSNSPALRVLVPIDRNDYLQAVNWEFEGLYEKMIRANHPIKVWAAFEKKAIPGVGVIVSEESAIRAADAEMRQGFDKDHIDLVKPRDRSDPVYGWVKSRILRTRP